MTSMLNLIRKVLTLSYKVLILIRKVQPNGSKRRLSKVTHTVQHDSHSTGSPVPINSRFYSPARMNDVE